MAIEASEFKYEEEFIVNLKGLKLFTCRWVPVDSEPKAVIFLNHGYGMECSVSMKEGDKFMDQWFTSHQNFSYAR